jgi:hypothetical protein
MSSRTRTTSPSIMPRLSSTSPGRTGPRSARRGEGRVRELGRRESAYRFKARRRRVDGVRWDAAGMVKAVGPDAILFRPGDRVWPRRRLSSSLTLLLKQLTKPFVCRRHTNAALHLISIMVNLSKRLANFSDLSLGRTRVIVYWRCAHRSTQFSRIS